MAKAVIGTDQIAGRIVVLRGEKVLFDSDLAELYAVPTKRFNEQVKRNIARFPSDFMFQLTVQEFAHLRSQIATSSTGRASSWGGRRYPPYAFTEHGAIMAATILNSPHAVEVSVYVVRAFVELRSMLTAHKDLARKLDELEARIEKRLTAHDQAIASILEAIRELMRPPAPPKRRPIGFVASND